jgi:hypothetical protein
MDQETRTSEPVPLEYRSARAAGRGAVAYVGLGVLAASAGLFGVCHWAAEYACQSVYHFRDVQPGTYAYVRALDGWEMDMWTETFTIALCSVAFFITQGLVRPDVAVRVRRGAWVLAGVAGFACCLVRWGIWYVSRGALPGWMDLGAAVGLAILLARGVSAHRWPGARGGDPALQGPA